MAAVSSICQKGFSAGTFVAVPTADEVAKDPAFHQPLADPSSPGILVAPNLLACAQVFKFFVGNMPLAKPPPIPPHIAAFNGLTAWHGSIRFEISCPKPLTPADSTPEPTEAPNPFDASPNAFAAVPPRGPAIAPSAPATAPLAAAAASCLEDNPENPPLVRIVAPTFTPAPITAPATTQANSPLGSTRLAGLLSTNRYKLRPAMIPRG